MAVVAAVLGTLGFVVLIVVLALLVMGFLKFMRAIRSLIETGEQLTKELASLRENESFSAIPALVKGFIEIGRTQVEATTSLEKSVGSFQRALIGGEAPGSAEPDAADVDREAAITEMVANGIPRERAERQVHGDAWNFKMTG